MAGYKRERRIYTLVFEDPEFNGLEIVVRSIPIRDLKHLMTLDPESDDPKVRVESINQLVRAFAEALVSWNMTDENDEPLPTTLEYIETEEMDFLMMCIGQWMAVVSRVDDASPLAGNLQPGQPILEESSQPS